MNERPTLTIELTPAQYLQVAAATGLLIDTLELDVGDLLAQVAPHVRIPRLFVQASTPADGREAADRRE